MTHDNTAGWATTAAVDAWLRGRQRTLAPLEGHPPAVPFAEAGLAGTLYYRPLPVGATCLLMESRRDWRDHAVVAALLRRLLVGWDLRHAGQSLPFGTATLLGLPAGVLRQMLEAVYRDLLRRQLAAGDGVAAAAD